MRRVPLTKKLLEQFEVEQERLKLEWVSAAEGARFAQVVTDFTSRIKELGPNPLKGRGEADSKYLITNFPVSVQPPYVSLSLSQSEMITLVLGLENPILS